MNLESQEITGYVYVPDKQKLFTGGKVGDREFINKDIELFANARPGDLVIKEDKKPPYIVVDHDWITSIITQWPGKLFKVSILNPLDEKDINTGLVENIWYTRTYGLKILEELPAEVVFGTNGKEIKNLLSLIQNITEVQVNQLAEYALEVNRKLYSETWNRWKNFCDGSSSIEDYENVIASQSKNSQVKSPIGIGLSVISNTFYQTVRKLTRDDALEIDEEGEVCLKAKWTAAGEHFLNAAMSYESNNLLTEQEKNQLRTPVTKVFENIANF